MMMLPLLLAAAAAPAGDESITVEVTNVRNGRGNVHVDICSQDQFLKEDCSFAAEAPAREGTTLVTIAHVPPGRYAAQVSHDENDNHKVDRGLFGIPKEGIGFSRDNQSTAFFRMPGMDPLYSGVEITSASAALTFLASFCVPSGRPEPVSISPS